MRISDWSSDVCSSDLYPGGESHAYRLSPDKRFLAFFDREYNAVVTDASNKLKLLSLESGTSEVIASGIRQDWSGAISWSPDSRRLANVSIEKKFEDEARASGKGTSHKRAGADMLIVDVDGDRVPRRVAGASKLYPFARKRNCSNTHHTCTPRMPSSDRV